jgi:hypothetical protein
MNWSHILETTLAVLLAKLLGELIDKMRGKNR